MSSVATMGEAVQKIQQTGDLPGWLPDPYHQGDLPPLEEGKPIRLPIYAPNDEFWRPYGKTRAEVKKIMEKWEAMALLPEA
jgi:hypothetical protein